MTLTDAQIAELKALPKRITNPKARSSAKERHVERNYSVYGGQDEFRLFTRQSTLDHVNFSCGLIWLAPDGNKVTLARYNGADHDHLNPIEGDRHASFTFHIHEATQRYMDAGRKPEQFAQPTTRYSNLNGALACLLVDWNITGLEAPPQEPLI